MLGVIGKPSRVEVDLIKALVEREAQIAVGPSTARGQGRGTVRALRAALAKIPLNDFAVSTAAQFHRILDRHTRLLQHRLPRNVVSWGLARKCLNIFLRDCYYNAFLMRRYQLHKAERVFEVPLDSLVAKELKLLFPRGALPKWPGVKHLRRTDSDEFQEAARRLSQCWGITRVHLDTFLWVRGRKSTPIHVFQRARRKRRAIKGRRSASWS